MNGTKRPLRAVPTVHVDTAEEKEHDQMDTDGTPGEPSAEQRRRRIAGACIHLGCCLFALIVDLLVIAAGVHFFRNGFLSGWLDGHGGEWAWFGAGAVACWWVGVETPHALSQILDACEQLAADRLRVRTGSALAEDGAPR